MAIRSVLGGDTGAIRWEHCARFTHCKVLQPRFSATVSGGRMTVSTIDSCVPGPASARLASVPLWVWWLVAVSAATLLALFAKGGDRTFEFIDSDDALRFVHVRDLLAGASWFEIKTSALGGANGLVSHWSRLIDAPMALLLGMLRLVLPERLAQMALVTIWPLALLGGLMGAIARATLEAHGRAVAHYALTLAALSLLAYYQFAPGRIDHHNVMIAASVSAALLMWAWPRDARIWGAAGALGGLALAVGYEALAPVFVLSAIAGCWALFDRRMSRQAGAYVTGLVAVLAVAFVATVPASRWLSVHCDALSSNMVALVAMAGGAFVLVMHGGAAWSWPRRIATLAAGVAGGGAMFGWLEPACLAGPMGQVPAALGPIWMDQVDEAKSLLADFMRGKIEGTIGPMSVFSAGLAAATFGLMRSGRREDRFLLAVSVAFVMLAMWQMKFMAYASFILVPGMAVAIARLPALGEIGAPAVRISAVIVLNQFALFLLPMMLKAAIVPATASSIDGATAAPPTSFLDCTKADTLHALAALPPGLVVTHTDIGTHLVVVSHHRVLSGPYHRIPDAIIANLAILMARSPMEAGRMLAKVGADYILTCRAVDEIVLKKPAWQGTLTEDLAAGRTPAFLAPVVVDNAPLLAMWRVDRARLPTP